MSIADKKSTHHHHHHHQTDLSSERERERGPDDSDEEGYGRLLTFPHPISITIPYLKVPGSWQIGRLATGRIYLVAARHGKGRGKGREGGREEGRRKGGEESGSGLCSLSLSLLPRGRVPGIYCFLFSVSFFFGLLTFFGGSWYVSSTSPISSSRVIVMSFSPSQSTLGGQNQIDRTGLVRWVGHHTKRLPNVGICIRAKYKFANSLC